MPSTPTFAIAGDPVEAAQPASVRLWLWAFARKLAAMHRARQKDAVAGIVRAGLAAID